MAYQKMIESSQSNMWEGHWACAVIALTKLLEEKLVPALLEDLIRKNLVKILDEHAQSIRFSIVSKHFVNGLCLN